MFRENRVVTWEEAEKAVETLAKINNVTKDEMRKRLNKISIETLEQMHKDDEKEDQLLDLACSYWRGYLSRFANTGEAPDILLTHIDHCPFCQSAVEFMFQRQARSFEEMAKKLREDRNKK